MADGSSGSNGWARVKGERTYWRECHYDEIWKQKQNTVGWLLESNRKLSALTAYHEWFCVIQVACKMNKKGQTNYNA